MDSIGGGGGGSLRGAQLMVHQGYNGGVNKLHIAMSMTALSFASDNRFSLMFFVSWLTINNSPTQTVTRNKI